MKKLLLFVGFALALQAAPATSEWFDSVASIATPAEKKLYFSLLPEARTKFQEDFWSGKSITAAEYYRRLQYIDATFGSSKRGSGAHTDPGRIYLALGAPNRITRVASSRIFVPLEIWYYDVVPEINLRTELRLIFYQKNALGLPRLYSPQLDTIRALLLPESGTTHMFGPNDALTEANIRTTLTVGPAEDEVVTAAVNVASGITSSGNQEVLSQIASPELILSRATRTQVRSRISFYHPEFQALQTGAAQMDLQWQTSAHREIRLQVLQGDVAVYENRLHLGFSAAKPVTYVHRLDLLPGFYRVVFSVDGQAYPYPLGVADHFKTGEIVRVDQTASQDSRHTPFEFDGSHFHLDPNGPFALLVLPELRAVTWVARRGLEVLWKTTTNGRQISVVRLPPGSYNLQASAGDDSRVADVVVKPERDVAPPAAFVSFNANLTPALRYASLAHQWLLRGQIGEARKNLRASLDAGATTAGQIELARADAMSGSLDAARDRIRAVLSAQPDNFEAISVLAYVEARFQDYPVAAELYRRALALQDSPALRAALAQLPK